MTICAASARLALDVAPGLPKLPHVPVSWDDLLTTDQQRENLLHVALWIVERDLPNFNMFLWHGKVTSINSSSLRPLYTYESCGTVHCIAGFAQVMAGSRGFTVDPGTAGCMLLGYEAAHHFTDTNSEGLAFLKSVIAAHS